MTKDNIKWQSVILQEISRFRISPTQALVLCLPTTIFMYLVRSHNLSKYNCPHLKIEENRVDFVELQRQVRIHICSVLSTGFCA